MDAIPLDPNALEIRLDNILRQLEQHRIDRNRISFPEDVEAVSGGYGIVHRGSLDAGSASSTIVAVKQLRPIGNRGQRLRVAVSFVRELAIWANLNHPNVLPFVGFFLNPTLEDAWLLSTFIFNGNICDYLAKAKPDLPHRVGLAIDSAKGLAYLHSRTPPISHGDIKSANVLVGDDRHALLCDFGLAKVVEDCPSGLTTSRFGQRGSLRYLSPELLIDPNPHRTLQSDVWAFGCLLLEILLDIMPYNNINVEHALILQIVQGAKPAPLEELPLPPEISALLAQCWQSATSRPDIQHCLETLQAYADSLALSASHLVIEEPETEVDYSSALNQESSPTIRARRRETSPEPPKSVKLDLVREIKGFSDIDGVRFSKDGLLVAAAYPQTIAIYYSITGEKKCSLNVNARCIPCFGPDGNCIANTRYKDVQLWDLPSRSLRRVFRGHTSQVNGLDFSSDGTFIASCSHDGSIRIWQVDNSRTQPHILLATPPKDVASVAISSDSKRVAGGSKDGTVRLWSTKDGALLESFPSSPESIRALVFTPNALALVSGDAVGTIRYWNLDTLVSSDIEDITENGNGKRKRGENGTPSSSTLVGHKGPIRTLATNDRGTWLVSGTAAGEVRFWNCVTGECIAIETVIGHGGVGMDFHNDEGGVRGHIASGSGDEILRIWEYRLVDA